jgi:hypothetical protein
MTEKQSEFQNVHQKRNFYSKFSKGAKITAFSLGVVSLGFIIKDSLFLNKELSNKIWDAETNIAELQNLSSHVDKINSVYEDNKSNKKIVLTGIDDLVEINKNNITTVKNDPLYLKEQYNLNNFNKIYGVVKYSFMLSVLTALFSSYKSLKYDDRYRELDILEINKIQEQTHKYIKENQIFSVNDLNQNLKENKLEPQYCSYDVVEHSLNTFSMIGTIVYDEKDKKYYSKDVFDVLKKAYFEKIETA